MRLHTQAPRRFWARQLAPRCDLNQRHDLRCAHCGSRTCMMYEDRCTLVCVAWWLDFGVGMARLEGSVARRRACAACGSRRQRGLLIGGGAWPAELRRRIVTPHVSSRSRLTTTVPDGRARTRRECSTIGVHPLLHLGCCWVLLSAGRTPFSLIEPVWCLLPQPYS
jgi:hypothetical protein